jgi:SAM-dependent methyltransferase
MMEFRNVYEDIRRAESYAKLEFPGTYYLAYRDLPQILAMHVKGTKALDFGCGTGRSTRFLKGLGFDAVGVDISEDMLRKAGELDPGGDYRRVDEGGFIEMGRGGYDLVLSVFTFDNIPTREKKLSLFAAFKNLLKPEGRVVNLVSSPEIYRNEWASFSTKDFPENKLARTGDRVRIIQTDVEDRRPVVDVIWEDEDYRDIFRRSGLEVVEVRRPLGKEDEPFAWVNETKTPPWVIYIMKQPNPIRSV